MYMLQTNDHESFIALLKTLSLDPKNITRVAAVFFNFLKD
jgi:hypothetical protein